MAPILMVDVMTLIDARMQSFAATHSDAPTTLCTSAPCPATKLDPRSARTDASNLALDASEQDESMADLPQLQ